MLIDLCQAFPKGSSIARDLSRAILNLTESEEIAEIERKWFGDQTTCADESSPFGSQSLDFVNFWGLFVITGSASVLSLVIYVVSFLYKNRRHLDDAAIEDSSLKGRVQSVAILYDQKDMNSHALRKGSAVRRRSMAGSGDPTAPPSLDKINAGDPIVLTAIIDTNMDSPMSISHHHAFEDESVSMEFASQFEEASPPAHIEVMTSNAC